MKSSVKTWSSSTFKKTISGFSILAIVILMLSTTLVASAHAELKSSSPADGSALSQIPSTITLTFSEALDTTDSTITVTAADGGRIDNQDAAVLKTDRTIMTVSLKSGSGDGTYKINWHAVADDDKGITQGTVTFNVGKISPKIPGQTPHSGGGGTSQANDKANGLVVAMVLTLLMVAFVFFKVFSAQLKGRK